MSTLTSSPSPAGSPHNPFLVPQRNTPYSRSPRASPRPFSSPKRTFNAPVAATRFPKQQQPAEGEKGRQQSSYVDAATQYSPEGYPPTAPRHKVAVTRTEAAQPPGSAGSAKKRKESTRSESPHHQQMSSSDVGAGSSAARNPPSEPQPRTDPELEGAVSQNASTTDLAKHEAVEQQQPEPEEARSTHGYSSAPKRSRPEPGTVKVMPLKYETCNPKDLGILISNMLMELIRLNDRIPLRDGKLTRFHSRAPPGISVSDYLQRLIQHATLSPPILLSMVWYIDRICALYPAFTINSLTVHRFLITAATVAAKGLSDSFWTNPTYARIGGIPVTELATLELEFLQRVYWKIVPKPEVLEEYYRSLVDRTQGFELETTGSESSSLDESEEGTKSAEGEEDEKMADELT
ncbi:hypothetical protein BAUCODRAFT_468787 [Baudoinia panamericana UAMH 10762]|uniref:Cyclin-like domain-containing protein n=1 Tax=Baudoinia panamericana (strain UAMH 10762) TaxID=717646 RepID=M2NAV3_BAUPA|nr:uncharacterized protein BAUCODRAFT_468787 [Baudoinia panamericana UAMH 10762]EMC96274.1 hypothetical protein BAUCODRAFT_468787 [Baudoinia panamericana UAMH 10762]